MERMLWDIPRSRCDLLGRFIGAGRRIQCCSYELARSLHCHMVSKFLAASGAVSTPMVQDSIPRPRHQQGRGGDVPSKSRDSKKLAYTHKH